VAEYVQSLTEAELALLAVGSGFRRVSGHNPGRNIEISRLQARAELDQVAALVEASDAARRWSEPLDVDHQTWINLRDGQPPRAGAVTWDLSASSSATRPSDSMWTSTELDCLASVWQTREPYDWPTLPVASTAWRVKARASTVRAYEIGAAADWVRLCEEFPTNTTSHYRRSMLSTLSLRWTEPFVTPDWVAMASEFDAVHLQWSGFVDCAEQVIPLASGSTIMHGWNSERTWWLRWCFSDWSVIAADEDIT
jgi:hypothetical protein